MQTDSNMEAYKYKAYNKDRRKAEGSSQFVVKEVEGEGVGVGSSSAGHRGVSIHYTVV